MEVESQQPRNNPMALKAIFSEWPWGSFWDMVPDNLWEDPSEIKWRVREHLCEEWDSCDIVFYDIVRAAFDRFDGGWVSAECIRPILEEIIEVAREMNRRCDTFLSITLDALGGEVEYERWEPKDTSKVFELLKWIYERCGSDVRMYRGSRRVMIQRSFPWIHFWLQSRPRAARLSKLFNVDTARVLKKLKERRARKEALRHFVEENVANTETLRGDTWTSVSEWRVMGPFDRYLYDARELVAVAIEGLKNGVYPKFPYTRKVIPLATMREALRLCGEDYPHTFSPMDVRALEVLLSLSANGTFNPLTNCYKSTWSVALRLASNIF